MACLKSPQRISPLNDLVENKKNRNMVLSRMAKEGMITDGEKIRMSREAVRVNPNPIRRGKSFLYEIVAEQARDLVGEEALSRGGYTIRTTIDAQVQRAAEESLARKLKEVESKEEYAIPGIRITIRRGESRYLQAALMVDHESGEVLAHVGGRITGTPNTILLKTGSATWTFFPLSTLRLLKMERALPRS